jgi:four helix bundle protein
MISDFGFRISDFGFRISDCQFSKRSEMKAMNKEELKARTKNFALRVLKLVDALPNSKAGNAVGGQLVRSGTSVGSNYRAACRGRSRAEFIAKIGVVEEEADESAFWLELITDQGLLRESQVVPLHTEATELTAIMASSRITASRHSPKSTISNRQSAIL